MMAPVKIPSSFTCRASVTSSSSSPLSVAFDAACIKCAVELADKSSGLMAPHSNFGCIIATTSGSGESVVVSEGYMYAQGTSPAELLAVEAAVAPPLISTWSPITALATKLRSLPCFRQELVELSPVSGILCNI